MLIKNRIRGYLPVVIDIETAGFNHNNDALLEICAIIIGVDKNDIFYPKMSQHFHIKPFKGANIEQSALAFNGIKINSPFRLAVSEKQALAEIYSQINAELAQQQCSRAILVGHNAFFDLGFLHAADKRSKLKSPLHQFSTLDTVSLSSLYFGETVLAKASKKAGLDWEDSNAHSALYDAQKTAELFCQIFNTHNFS